MPRAIAMAASMRATRSNWPAQTSVCSVLRRETKLPQTFQRQDLRDRIYRETLRGTADGVCPIEAALRALAIYAALAPVPKAGSDVREWAAPDGVHWDGWNTGTTPAGRG